MRDRDASAHIQQMNMGADTGAAFAYSAPRVFDGERILEDYAVIVEHSMVTDVVPSLDLPPDFPVHRSDCTIIPGLIDTHVHFMRWQGAVFLAYGVTTIRDTGNDLRWILQRRKEWPKQLWPRILCMGPLLDGPSPNHPVVARRITDLASATTAVRETVAAGVDGIKLYVGVDPDWLSAMARESHEGGLKISMHCLANGVLVAGRSGIDEFYHLDGVLADVWPDHPSGWLEVWGDPDFARTWDRQLYVADAARDLGMTATPTLAYWESQWRLRTEIGASSEERRYMPPELAQWASAQRDPAAAVRWRRALDAAQRFVGLLLERGVPVLAGSDTPCGGILPGQSLWRELSLLVEAGMSPEGALRAATSGAADFLERPQLGRLRKGQCADVVFVRGDLSKQIPEHPEIALVIRGGDVYQPSELLATAKADMWQADPWARQFELHGSRRQGGEGGEEKG
ncbi:MAG TPA: hypothetical protein EYM39_00050 [Candidatus Latescibacteria bacterium]|nr:hypothetical protein [Candidatus Latescibacterota bacterium]